MQKLPDRIRFFRYGDVDRAFIHNLVIRLRSVQNGFIIDLAPDPIPVRTEPNETGEHDEDQIEECTVLEARKRFPGEYPVILTSVPFSGCNETSFNQYCALISLHDWHLRYMNVSHEDVVAFHLVDILLSRRIETPVHGLRDLRRCPCDCCGNADAIVDAMRVGDFCVDCRRALRGGLNTGSLPLEEFAALYRVLDSISGVRRAFVIAPFGREFDLVYRDHIRPTLESAGLTPRRIDESTESAEITSLIQEETVRAHLVVADLSGRNPNVFYEIGFAHANGIPGILLIQDISEAPFDVRQWRMITYRLEDIEKLDRELALQASAQVGASTYGIKGDPPTGAV